MTLADALKRLLSSQIDMFLMAWGFHWNVEGPLFPQYHDFFGEIQSDVYGSVDPTAENIRKLRSPAPFALSALDKLSDVEDHRVKADPMEMCKALLDANDAVLEAIDEAFQLATDANEQGIADFLASRDDMHKKWRWQLEVSTR